MAAGQNTPSKPVVTDWPIGSEGLFLTIDGNTFTLVADMTTSQGQTGAPAKPGKSIMVSKTVGGAVDVPGKPGWKMQFFLTRPPTTAEALVIRSGGFIDPPDAD